VWQRLEADRWVVQPLLAELNAARPHPAREITRAQLGDALGVLAAADAEAHAQPRWPAVALLVAMVQAILVVLLIGTLWPRPAPPRLVAAADLAPYRVLLPSDVNVQPANADADAAKALRALALGRYPVRPIAKNAPVVAATLVNAAGFDGLNERSLVTVRVHAPDPGLSAAVPARVSLSAPSGDTFVECQDVYLLALRPVPESASLATVALPDACAPDHVSTLTAAKTVALRWVRP
jgi:hypothetical protein